MRSPDIPTGISKLRLHCMLKMYLRRITLYSVWCVTEIYIQYRHATLVYCMKLNYYHFHH